MGWTGGAIRRSTGNVCSVQNPSGSKSTFLLVRCGDDAFCITSMVHWWFYRRTYLEPPTNET
eukprot:CAMPEP_0113956960 /NCGR_PEP_ID=MMETSP0011_2-20120614/2413_1 /TAXON_ID=101924 /ORGANISM="Rhodosorus marinus" /LENGTH=61 /DNA_ID=CAMNT_0000967287 /DNA_START=162 /DNA_END=347 /DNA_ORIENTATION=+ /assembly_acc=CAM_ASM_000156